MQLLVKGLTLYLWAVHAFLFWLKAACIADQSSEDWTDIAEPPDRQLQLVNNSIDEDSATKAVEYFFVGDGFCRPLGCNIDVDGCLVNGFYKMNSNSTECRNACSGMARCIGYAISEPYYSAAPNKCFVHTLREAATPPTYESHQYSSMSSSRSEFRTGVEGPEQWTTFNYDYFTIGKASGYRGVTCYVKGNCGSECREAYHAVNLKCVTSALSKTQGTCNGTHFHCSLNEKCSYQLDGAAGLSQSSFFTISAGPCQKPEPNELLRMSIAGGMGVLPGLHRLGQARSIEIEFSPTPTTLGETSICWSPGHIPARVPIGILHVWPVLSSRSLCTLGVACSIQLSQYSGASVRLDNSELAVVPQSSRSCDRFSDLGKMWANQWVILRNTGQHDSLQYGIARLGVASRRLAVGNHHRLCWHPAHSAQHESQNEELNTSTGGAKTKGFPVGVLSIIGPNAEDVHPDCSLGIPCEVAISGLMFGSAPGRLILCDDGYKPEMVKLTVASRTPEMADLPSKKEVVTFTANFMRASEGRSEKALCWQATEYTETIQVGFVTLKNECPRPGETWPERNAGITLPAGRSQAFLYVASECEEGSPCRGCTAASDEGVIFNEAAYFVFAGETMQVSSCSSKLVCSALNCTVALRGPQKVSIGQKLTASAYVNGRYVCTREAEVTIVAFGCQQFVVINFMVGVGLVLLATVAIGLALEAIAKASVKTSLEGNVQIRCTDEERPSLPALRNCIAQSVAPDQLQSFDAWSSGPVVFARFQLTSKSKPVRHWVTEVPGLCRVDAASMHQVRQPGRLPGAGLLELAETCAHSLAKQSWEEQERLHFEYAIALLQELRKPHIQALLFSQYFLTIAAAVGLPLVAGHMMESCEDGYPAILHCVWAAFLLLQGSFQWYLLSRSCPDRGVSKRFIQRFWLRLIAGWCVGAVCQTDMYMDFTFPVIAKSCNFELWIVAVWLCTLGIGIGQVGQSVTVILLGCLRARKAASPERRERAELSVLFFLLRVTDNVALCFAVRPVLHQRLGGPSSWAARVAEARVPAARFIFEDVEQSALQVIFLVFFNVATAADIVWIALSIATSLFLSLLLMVQVLPEIRDWVWHRLLSVAPRPCRIPLLLIVFMMYRFIASSPWMVACSRFVADTTFFGLEVRQQVIDELFTGIAMTTAGMGACCLIMHVALKLQSKKSASYQTPVYNAQARLSPKAFGAWSTEQDEWLEPLRRCMAEEVQAERRSAMERLDHQLFKLRHGLSNRSQALKALNDKLVPDTVARCGEGVLHAAELREQVQKTLKDWRFTRAQLQTKSKMIDAMVTKAFSNTRLFKNTLAHGFFRLLPYRILKNGIPRSSQGLTVSVAQAEEQAGKRRMAVIAVSHCWLAVDSSPPHPDNEAMDKARSLTNFAEWYIRYWGDDVEVFYWIDYSCIDQDSRDVSVAMLPILIASCTTMVLWRTEDYETRSWTAMERILAYSYCEGGLTPYVIDAGFTGDVKEPRWEPRKLPDPWSASSASLVSNTSDHHLIQQLLQCVFAVPAFELFPDRQSIFFGETEVVHLDLTRRDPLRTADTAADGFIDGVDRRVWISAADRPPAVSIGVKVRTKDQVAMLMPADVVDTFIPIIPGTLAERSKDAAAHLPSVVARFEDLLQRGARPSEMDFALLLDVLEKEYEAAMFADDEQRLIKAVDISQNFEAFPPAAVQARRHLCKSKLQAALKGSDRALQHALQLAQQYRVDAHNFPELRSAVAEQDRRRAAGLKTELEEHISEADRTRDDVLMFAAWQVAKKAVAVSVSSEVFSDLAETAKQGVVDIMAQKLRFPGVHDNAEELHRILVLAADYSVEQSEAVEEAREKLSVMWLDLEIMKDRIHLSSHDFQGPSVQDYCEEVLKHGGNICWIYKPLLAKLIEWGVDQAPDELQETLRVATILGLSQDDPTFRAGVDKLQEVLEDGLPADWDILRKEWSQAHLFVQQSKVDDLQLVNSIQTLFDSTMVGHDVASCDRCTGTVPTRLKVKRVMKVRHPGNYLRYKTCRAKMIDSIASKESVQELGSCKTDAASRLPGLVDGRELNASLNEVMLFHGTSYHAADGIAAQGFRMDMAGRWTGSMFGRGAYFAERCLKSDEYAGCCHESRTCSCKTERPILVCRVLLGKFKYTDDMAPDRCALEYACLNGDCDSVLADREAANIRRGRNPTFREFVVFDKGQVYPEYVVWYTRCFGEAIPESLHTAVEQAQPDSTASSAGVTIL